MKLLLKFLKKHILSNIEVDHRIKGGYLMIEVKFLNERIFFYERDLIPENPDRAAFNIKSNSNIKIK